MPPFPTITVSNARKVYASRAEVERIVARLPDDVKPAVRALAWMGWRAREVLGIRWCDVDSDAQTIKLPAERSKNKRARFFPYGALPPLAALIEERRQLTATRQRELRKTIPTVFWRGDGAPLSYDVFRAAWVEAAKEAKLSHLRPHDMRRGAARALVRAGVNERVVMRLLGWETPAMLARYDIVATSDLAEGVARLGAYLGAEPARFKDDSRTEATAANAEGVRERAAGHADKDGATPQNRTGDTVIFRQTSAAEPGETTGTQGN